MPLETLSASVSPAAAGQRVLQFARREFSKVLQSEAEAKRAVGRGQLSRNGAVVGNRGAERVVAGDELALECDPTALKLERLRAGVPGVEVLYEDDQLAVLTKPAGVQSVSTQQAHTRTIVRVLPAYLASSSAVDALPAPALVYMLDNSATGLLLAAKTVGASATLAAQLSSGQLRRRYRALAAGKLHGQPDMATGSAAQNPLAVEVSTAELSRSEAVGWLSTVELQLAGPDGNKQLRELLSARGCSLIGHRGEGGLGKGSWLACVGLSFAALPDPAGIPGGLVGSATTRETVRQHRASLPTVAPFEPFVNTCVGGVRCSLSFRSRPSSRVFGRVRPGGGRRRLPVVPPRSAPTLRADRHHPPRRQPPVGRGLEPTSRCQRRILPGTSTLEVSSARRTWQCSC